MIPGTTGLSCWEAISSVMAPFFFEKQNMLMIFGLMPYIYSVFFRCNLLKPGKISWFFGQFTFFWHTFLTLLIILFKTPSTCDFQSKEIW